jgi:small GTP-binding protein
MQLQSVKAVFLGDSGVGKTSLFNAICLEEKALPDHIPTVGVDYQVYPYQSDGVNLEITFFDTAGQEKYRAFTPHYLRNANICYLVFGFNDRSSFDNLGDWVQLIRNQDPSTPIVLVCNKDDIEKAEQKVSEEEIQEVARNLNVDNVLRTSAKYLTGVKELVKENIQLIIGRKMDVLPRPPTPREEKSNCC